MESFSIKLVALPMLLVIALIGMLVGHPSASKWISDAAQAEFAGQFITPDIVPELAPPTRVAQPSNEIRHVNAY